jgi:peptidoglycan hydrolase-like protein with peptidoglycan-binding domain
MPSHAYPARATDAASSTGTSTAVTQAGGGVGNAANLDASGLTGAGAGPKPMLRFGSQGPAVSGLQSLLNGQGASLVVDGIFGALTQGAVRAFQSVASLVVDGVVGPQTWGALSAIAPSAPSLVPDEAPAEANAAAASGATQASEAAPEGPTQGGGQADSAGVSSSGDVLLDEMDFFTRSWTAPSAAFDPYVSSKRLSTGLALPLAGLGTLQGEGKATHDLALGGLADGSLLAIVYQADLPAALRQLPATDPDRARIAQVAAGVNEAIFIPTADQTRGILVVRDGTSSESRTLATLLGHELNHYRSRGAADPVLMSSALDLPGAGAGMDAESVASTRQSFIDEIAAQHVEWSIAWDIRLARQQMDGSAAPLPEPAALLGACLDFVQAEAIGGTAYDPVGYWASLDKRSPEAVEQQIKAWLPLVAYRTLSADPMRDAAAKMVFFGAALATPKWPSDGLGQNI